MLKVLKIILLAEKPQCAWFKWAGNPQYLVVDTSSEMEYSSALKPIDLILLKR